MNIPPLGLTVRVYVDGVPGFYAAICDECTEGGVHRGAHGSGVTRHYKRDANHDLNFHLEAHLAWAKGERHLDWPRG